MMLLVDFKSKLCILTVSQKRVRSYFQHFNEAVVSNIFS